MSLHFELYSFLLILLIIQTLFYFLIYYRLNRNNNVKEGIEIGSPLSEINIDIGNGGRDLLNEIIHRDARVFVFLDMNCTECNKLLNVLNIIKIERLEGFRLIITKSEDNMSKICEYSLFEKSFFLDLDTIKEIFNIRSFPILMKFDKNAVVIDKSYASTEKILQYVT